ncbi:MAG TPA: Gfo/Idh/MocA family oxidoreductase [Armatimonadota bacterium]|jgi:predicted dehydrogenase|nr:Gfo/Idh/MocA family oxidoreductase [Armatimonadota bacterium]HOJ21269.1 Gfo/Idh/MocA family oxidoreductase [Armatimonadota bacterium]HOM81565.1 Gfo/Idh/MocA family oxidoreductase [Armatimonadota bacterium]HPO71158.1 Gfo/Idh/MocA family oxidoreductase [Armatimonadota bacterium]HPT97226.1 Gfo/Idh/MocA family oxidoreductase [Armatimonadota bacterium]
MINLGLIGCGALGKIHAQCIAQIPEARFVAYVDKVEDAAEAALKQFGGDYATTDVETLLCDDSVDAVYICTRHDSHASLAIAAARAGKHILIEKPLALRIEECEAVAEAVKRAGVTLMPAFKMRFYPLVQMAHEFIPNPQVMVGQMMDNRWGDNIWPQDPVQGGANVHSQGCHTTDLLRFFAGSEPTRLWASGGTLTHPGHPCIDQCIASIQFANGHTAAWIQGDAATSHFTSKFFFELFGNGKSVQLYDRFKKATFFDGQKTWVEERPDEEGFLLENREFISALQEGRQPVLTAHDGIQATRIVLAADRAIRTGEVQTL